MPAATALAEPARRVIDGAPLAQHDLRCDLCVVGAGAAGVSAAVEASRLRLDVCLLDGLPQLGGQSVNGLIGTLCGFYSAEPHPVQLQYGFAADVVDGLDASRALSYRRSRGTLVALYDEQELAGLYARHLREAGVRLVLGAVVRHVERVGATLRTLHAQTRYGAMSVTARTFIDASGDAALAAAAGLPLTQADGPVFGTTMFSLTGLGASVPPREEIEARLRERATQYGLQRLDGFVFGFPGRDSCLVNLTHHETPLDPIAMSRVAVEGRAAVDAVVTFLKNEFPAAFETARLLAVGQPGVRQTRGIRARATLRTADVRSGRRPADAVARSAWPIEFHGTREAVHWETFGAGHLAWVPLSAMLARDAENLIAAGRCIDAEPFALSAVRVIGPCMAMGAAAAAAACAGGDRLHALDAGRVQALVRDNLERRDPAPAV